MTHIKFDLKLMPSQVKLQAEIEALKARGETRRSAQSRPEHNTTPHRADVSMESFAEGIAV